jgi:hypothetical protein
MKAGTFATLVTCVVLATLGCGPTFSPPTEVKSLRVLGVSKDKPYAVPGDDVTLTMLWYDGSEAGQAMPPRDVGITWLGGCLNPAGDSYQGCFEQYGAALGGSSMSSGPPRMAPAANVTLGSGAKFTVHIPTDSDNGAPVLHPSQDPKLPYYGLTYVFFSLCPGKIAPGDEHFPIHCLDKDSNAVLGPDDFVIGYSAIYFFAPRPNGEPYTNANPITTGFYFGPADVTAAPGTCLGDTCLGSCTPDPSDPTAPDCVNPPLPQPQDFDCETYPTLCMPLCKDDGNPQKCPPHDLRLAIDPHTFEKDDVTNDAYGQNYGEQMWIDYYSTFGNFRSSTKLLNDATTGYNSQNGTQFYAPNVKGLVPIWAVIHDNRGGVSWAGTTLKIQ